MVGSSDIHDIQGAAKGQRGASIRDCLREAAVRLQACSDSARRDAEILLAHVLEKDRAYLFAWPEKMLHGDRYAHWLALLERRAAGEPVAYIVGEKEFWSLSFYTNSSTLIPRPDTEMLVERALALLPARPCRILDLGTGSGAIAIAIAVERPDCQVDAVDSSKDALELAQSNCNRHAARNVSLFLSDWFESVAETYQLIVSNPPYIDRMDTHLTVGDLRYEPESALVAEDHGLADIKNIVSQAQAHLVSQGWLLVEHGWKQKNEVQNLFTAGAYRAVATIQDYAGNDRVTLGQKR